MSEWKYYRYNYSPSEEPEYVVIVDENDYIIAKRILGQDYPEQYPFIKHAHNKVCEKYKKEIADLKAEINNKDNANTILIQELEKLKNELNDWKIGSQHEAFYGDEARCEATELKSTIDSLLKALPKDTFTSYAYEQSDFMGFLLAVYKILYNSNKTLMDGFTEL